LLALASIELPANIQVLNAQFDCPDPRKSPRTIAGRDD
jgi:hypothetical protein